MCNTSWPALSWVAVYTDGTSLSEYTPDGEKNGYHNIDRSRLQEFQLWAGEDLRHSLTIEPGQRLIWRRRRFKSTDGGEQTMHLVGWQRTIAGENVQSIVCLSEESSLSVAIGAWRDDFAPFCAPELLPHELE